MQNRSISQQTLTILEEYLEMRSRMRPEPSCPRADSPEAPWSINQRPRLLYSNEQRDGTDYLAKRRAIFERLEKLPPLPITKTAPRADILLAQIREEEAR
jgi:hypothetical protein